MWSLTRSALLSVLERLTPSTAATRFRGLQQCYRWAVEEEIIVTSPMARMHPPAIPEVPVPVVSMDDLRLRLLLKVCEGRSFTERRDTAILRLFLEPGGLRLSELTNPGSLQPAIRTHGGPEYGIAGGGSAENGRACPQTVF